MASGHGQSSADTDTVLSLEDKAVEKSQRGKGGRGAGRRSQGSSGKDRDMQVSKALSRLLRHQAINAGIPLDSEGFAPLDRVLAWGPIKSLQVSLAEVQALVASNDKQRFSLKPNLNLTTTTNPPTSPADFLIRANQGHSIKVESASHLVPITLEAGNVPPAALHGTYFAFWPRIVASGGLRPMGRNHLHCSTGLPEEGVTSGMRRDAELVVEIDVPASLQAGTKWWMSENGVVLTEGDDEHGLVSSRFFKKVTGRRVDVGVLWRDGEWVADLPEGIKGRVPQGKGPRGGGGGGRGGGGRGGRRGGS